MLKYFGNIMFIFNCNSDSHNVKATYNPGYFNNSIHKIHNGTLDDQVKVVPIFDPLSYF